MQRKDVGLRIRVDRNLRDSFVEACRSQEMGASEVLREFMRQYAQQLNFQAGQLKLRLLNNENQFK